MLNAELKQIGSILLLGFTLVPFLEPWTPCQVPFSLFGLANVKLMLKILAS